MLINVQLQPDAAITQMDELDLIKKVGGIDNDVELTTWVEYRLKADPNAERAVHRSVHVVLKKPSVFSEGEIGQFA